MNSLLSMSFRVSAATLRREPVPHLPLHARHRHRRRVARRGALARRRHAAVRAPAGRRDDRPSGDRREPADDAHGGRRFVPLDSVVEWGPADAIALGAELGAAAPSRARPFPSRHSPSRRADRAQCASSARRRVCSGRSASKSPPAVRSPTPTPPRASCCSLLRRRVRSRREARASLQPGDTVVLNHVPLTLIGVTRRAAGRHEPRRRRADRRRRARWFRRERPGRHR